MTNLVVHADREDVSARFNLSAFVTDWDAARQTFIACIAKAFREPLNPRPEDFSTAFPTELGEAWCKYRVLGGSSTIVLRADSLALNFPNITRADYTLVSEVLCRCVDDLLPALGNYEAHSYFISTNRHAAAVNGQSEQYLSRHSSAHIKNAARDLAMDYSPCIGFSLGSSDGYRVLRRTIERSEVLENGLFITDHLFVRMPELTKFEEEARLARHFSSMANRTAGIKDQDNEEGVGDPTDP